MTRKSHFSTIVKNRLKTIFILMLMVPFNPMMPITADGHQSSGTSTSSPGLNLLGGSGSLIEVAELLGVTQFTPEQKTVLNNKTVRIAIIDDGLSKSMFDHVQSLTNNAIKELMFVDRESTGEPFPSPFWSGGNDPKYWDPMLSKKDGGGTSGHGDMVLDTIVQMYQKAGIDYPQLSFYKYDDYAGDSLVEKGKRVTGILKYLNNDGAPKADIISVSAGFFDDNYDSMRTQLQRLKSNGVLVIGAYGNTNTDFSNTAKTLTEPLPAKSAYALAVGAVYYQGSSKGKRIVEDLWGSNYGPRLDFVMPGIDIEVQADKSESGEGPLKNYLFEGTSAATPIFSAVASMAWKIWKNERPSESLDNFIVYLETSTEKLQISGSDKRAYFPISGVVLGATDFDNELGYGIVDILDFYTYLITPSSGDNGGGSGGGSGGDTCINYCFY